VTCGEADFAMRERNSPVREEGSRAIAGRWEGSFCCTAVGNFVRCSAGMVAVVLLEGLWLTGLGARLLSSATPMQQNNPRLLCGFGRAFDRGDCWETWPTLSEAFSGSGTGTGFRCCRRSFFCSTSRRPNRSTNVSMLVRSRIVDDWRP